MCLCVCFSLLNCVYTEMFDQPKEKNGFVSLEVSTQTYWGRPSAGHKFCKLNMFKSFQNVVSFLPSGNHTWLCWKISQFVRWSSQLWTSIFDRNFPGSNLRVSGAPAPQWIAVPRKWNIAWDVGPPDISKTIKRPLTIVVSIRNHSWTYTPT
jgi:hypothetical protein